MSSSFFKLIIGLVLLAVLIQPIAAEACSFCEFINLSKGDPGPQGPQGEMNQTPGSAGTTSHNLLLNLTSDDHPQYPNMSGRDGGQTLTGGTTLGNLVLLSNGANTGQIYLGSIPIKYGSTAQVLMGGEGITSTVHVINSRGYSRFGLISNTSNAVQTWYIYGGLTTADFSIRDGTGTGYNAILVNHTTHNLGIGGFSGGTDVPTEKLDIKSNNIRIRTANTPASNSSVCDQGEISWDVNYIYVCTATNTWKRAGLSTW